jgi:glycosyltransferase involved in cell wall biosynthesis
MTTPVSVTVAIPVRNEEACIERCLASITAQTSDAIIEILVADGRSTDRTREIAERVDLVRVIDNPGVRQAAGLNAILAVARGEVIVRVDGHCELAPDYVERCLAALERTGAAVVGGAMTPVAGGGMPGAVAAAMTSSLGAGPARFHVGGAAGWTDTVYLGAYRTETARSIGGYAEDVGVNEDAEFALRMAERGGVWFDPAIQSRYSPRSGLRAVAKQFYWYGRSRAATVKKHPGSISTRQLAAPLLVASLLSPARTRAAQAYLGVLALGAWQARRRGLGVAVRVPLAMGAMHLAWGTGFLVGGAAAPPSIARSARRSGIRERRAP